MNEKCLRHKNFRSCVHCSRRNSFIRRKLPFICLLTIKPMYDIIFYISFLQILIPHSIILRTHSRNKYLIYLEMIILESIIIPNGSTIFWLQRFITKYKCMLLIKEITNNCVSSATKIKCTLCSTTCLIISLFKLLASMRQIRLSSKFFSHFICQSKIVILCLNTN